MSKNPLRKDKTCLNCRHVVENRFCPKCGQENIETRKTFYQLFVHFFEDLTHYENAFWKTIKNLLLKPSTLTKEYLSGKRLSYLAPVRLYIFISLITFFLISVLSSKNFGITTMEKNETETVSQKAKKGGYSIFGYHSTQQLDSIKKHGSKADQLPPFQFWITKKALVVFENNTQEEIIKKFTTSYIHNFPKLLFLNMPVFAFFLWLFHNKKRWYYFDHGIFTHHYFSFLLLTVLILFLSNKLFSLLEESGFANFFIGMVNFFGFSWMFYYIYPAHHRFFGETRLISFFKTTLLLFINFWAMLLLLLLFAFYTFINLE